MVILGGHVSMKPVNSSFKVNPCLITKLYSLKYKVSLVWCMRVAHESHTIFNLCFSLLLQEKLVRNRQDRYHRIKSAHFQRYDQVKEVTREVKLPDISPTPTTLTPSPTCSDRSTKGTNSMSKTTTPLG